MRESRTGPPGPPSSPRGPAGVLVVATTNADKIAELHPVLAPILDCLGLVLHPLAPDAPPVAEDRPTFSGNAVLKATVAADRSGKVCLAEDSGLEVDALDGAPGVLSARYSGGGPAANNQLLLERMSRVPKGRRGARFRTVAAVKVPGGPLFVAEGTAEGEIADQPRGAGGFGYDPVFLSKDLGRTFAEASPEEKLRVSHRSRALRAIRGYLFEAYEDQDFDTPRGRLPGHGSCVKSLLAAQCPPGLVAHQLGVARLCRELALSLAEAGVPVDVRLVAAAGLLHDIGKSLSADSWTAGRSPGAELPEGGGGARSAAGVAGHARVSAGWLAARGFDPRLQRTVLVHGLDSLLAPAYQPSTWEERVLMLGDKLVEKTYVGLEARLVGLGRRHPSSRKLVADSASPLRKLELELASACRVTPAEIDRRLAAALKVTVVRDPR